MTSRDSTSLNRQPSLYCPHCQRLTKKVEWRVILRRVLGAERHPPLRVLEHMTCETMVYFLLE
jgi:hypothetical protein